MGGAERIGGARSSDGSFNGQRDDLGCAVASFRCTSHAMQQRGRGRAAIPLLNDAPRVLDKEGPAKDDVGVRPKQQVNGVPADQQMGEAMLERGGD